MASNIILTGFMGTGKSSVGRRLANRLRRPFVDMDTKIEHQEGRSISEIFANEGESYFRDLERALVLEISGQEDLVVSTGGGVLMDPRNLADFRKSGTVICLCTTVDTILDRVMRDRKRPLLDCEDPRAKIEDLLAERQAMYQAVSIQVDTTGASHDEVCDRIINTAL